MTSKDFLYEPLIKIIYLAYLTNINEVLLSRKPQKWQISVTLIPEFDLGGASLSDEVSSKESTTPEEEKETDEKETEEKVTRWRDVFFYSNNGLSEVWALIDLQKTVV